MYVTYKKSTLIQCANINDKLLYVCIYIQIYMQVDDNKYMSKNNIQKKDYS